MHFSRVANCHVEITTSQGSPMIKDDPYIIENKYDDVGEKSRQKKTKQKHGQQDLCLPNTPIPLTHQPILSIKNLVKHPKFGQRF